MKKPKPLPWLGDLFRWIGRGFDNLGDWARENNISFGVGFNYSGSNGLTPYGNVSTPLLPNFSLGYNMDSGNIGIGNNMGGFSNFWYPGQNNITEQIVDVAIAKARSEGDGWEFFVGTFGSIAEEIYYSKKYGTWMGFSLQTPARRDFI